MDFAVPADHRLKIKENEKIDEYLNFAIEVRKLRNIEVTAIPIVVDELEMVAKAEEKEMEEVEISERIETIKTTTMLRSARILTRFLDIWGDLLSLILLWKTIS